MISEALMRDRQHQLEVAVARSWQVRELLLTRRAPLRAATGRFLMRAGGRLAQQDPDRLSPGRWATS
jgi:hypothetical protein